MYYRGDLSSPTALEFGAQTDEIGPNCLIAAKTHAEVEESPFVTQTDSRPSAANWFRVQGL